MALAEPDRRILIAFAVIETDNLLVMSLRQFTKSTLLGARDSEGKRVITSCTATEPREAAASVLSVLNSPKYLNALKAPKIIDERDEQIYRSLIDCDKVLSHFNATNRHRLQFAMQFNGEVFSEVGTVRNFFAHRAEGTAIKVIRMARQLGIAKVVDAENFVLTPRPATGVPIWDGWLSDLETFFTEAY